MVWWRPTPPHPGVKSVHFVRVAPPAVVLPVSCAPRELLDVVVELVPTEGLPVADLLPGGAPVCALLVRLLLGHGGGAPLGPDPTLGGAEL